MRVLFINPSRAGQGNIPLNIPLLISTLKKNKHDVRLFDLTDYFIFDDQPNVRIFFKEAPFTNTQQVIRERTQFYNGDFDVGPDGLKLKTSDYTSDFEKILKDFKPELLAVSCLSVDFNFIVDFLSPFKKKYKIPVVFGGIHSILLPEEVLHNDVVDYVCVGEGENCLPHMLDVLEKGSPIDTVGGIWFKRNGKIFKNPLASLTDISLLPAPDFDCFDPIHFYRAFDGKRYKMVNYEFSRGCPYSCSYCVNGILRTKYKDLGRYHRIKGIDQSINELKQLINKYGFDFIRFWDEDFTSISVNLLEKYANLYVKEINLPFIIYARVNSVNERKIEILKEMGCKTIAMGIESGNEYIRKNVMNRNMSNKMISEKFSLVKQYGIRVSAYNIIGLPRETREHIFDTIKLNKFIEPDSFSVTLLEPYRGTPIREMCETEGLDPSHELDGFHCDEPQFTPKGMKPQELKGLYRTFPLYVRFPQNRYEEIKIAEGDQDTYEKLLEEFQKLK